MDKIMLVGFCVMFAVIVGGLAYLNTGKRVIKGLNARQITLTGSLRHEFFLIIPCSGSSRKITLKFPGQAMKTGASWYPG